MPSVGIVGAGLIGRSWAMVFARAGWDVRITDPDPRTLADVQRLIREGLDELARHDLVADPAQAAGRITALSSLAEAVADADLVQENGPENVDVKRTIFAELDELAPSGCILASSTSAIVASRFTEELPGRGRCVVAHPVNPLTSYPWWNCAGRRGRLRRRSPEQSISMKPSSRSPSSSITRSKVSFSIGSRVRCSPKRFDSWVRA